MLWSFLCLVGGGKKEVADSPGGVLGVTCIEESRSRGIPVGVGIPSGAGGRMCVQVGRGVTAQAAAEQLD